MSLIAEYIVTGRFLTAAEAEVRAVTTLLSAGFRFPLNGTGIMTDAVKSLRHAD